MTKSLCPAAERRQVLQMMLEKDADAGGGSGGGDGAGGDDDGDDGDEDDDHVGDDNSDDDHDDGEEESQGDGFPVIIYISSCPWSRICSVRLLLKPTSIYS